MATAKLIKREQLCQRTPNEHAEAQTQSVMSKTGTVVSSWLAERRQPPVGARAAFRALFARQRNTQAAGGNDR